MTRLLSGLQKYKQVYSHLWQTYGQSRYLRLSFVAQVINRIIRLVALPVALSMVIAELSRGNFNGAYAGVGLFVAGSLTVGILAPLIKYIGMKGENIVYDSSTATYFSRLVHADIDYFNANMSGYLTTATRQYVDGCVQLVRAMRDRYIPTIVSIVFPLVVITWIDAWLGAVTLGLSVLQAVYLLWASNAIAPLRTQARELYRKNSGRMADIISNILAVKSNAHESTYAEQVKQDAIAEAQAFDRRYTLQAKLIAVREFISVTFFMALLLLVVHQMAQGAIDIAGAVLVVTYTTTIMGGIYTLSDDLDDHDDWVDKIMPAFEVLNRQNKIADSPKPKKLPVVKGDIAFTDVTFGYDSSRKIFDSFVLRIPAGQKVGIVGLSGAGKSTLVKLLLRFNDVTDGQVTIDGIDVRDVKQADLRRQIAYVPQEPLLFHDSIKQNVLLGQPNASDKQVERALKVAHAWQFIAQLPGGVHGVVGERGVKLSGGQKQRIAIARAVLRKAPIIVLDEATSALDSESEQIIKDSFKDILKGKTALVIAHRLSTLSQMDRIVVIQNGKCIQDGTHQQLLAKDGAYAKLWNRQLHHTDPELVELELA